MSTEWACQYKTFIDGDYDHLIAREEFGNRPLTREAAEEHVTRLNQRHPIARLVSREVTDWKASE
ncbi:MULTISPECIES: hypothetical protein [Paenarthrobacter]|uniref:Uncharacterized protein n=1 Tax=Paenarthrobacter ureafaciens TaxID=37931 RepID=A0AAX3EFX2_PAEUR|nr:MULTISPECIES: hypothetical protein [Paenarthrobacter]MDO5866015.1 hypothetical protein [Paenarthrobacter sp. SD-2]MDO5877111.1 hypothetical protein [Paenarthrobacter sp. SD-1]UYV92313.1 hypothetical protein NL395_17590 [Paenarthrobacter ureafaciens]UYV96848.1 hypothetical protein NL394_17620 [Paenarthrobacter ureafaciens]